MLKSFSRFASKIPQWNGKNCLQCFSCALACPTSALRPFLLSKNEPSINAVNVTGKADEFFKIQVSPNDCIGCGKCLKTCPTSSLTMVEIVLAVEDAVGMSIDNEEIQNLHTLGDIKNFIRNKIAQK